MKIRKRYVAFALVMAGLIWLVFTDSNVVRSCEHRGGQIDEANGACTLGQK